MFTRRTVHLLLLTMLIAALTACSAVAMHNSRPYHSHVLQNGPDPISGDWDVSFKVEGNSTPAEFTLKLEGDKVTGTAYSQHTGAGKLRDGKWKDGKLSFTLDFEKHESIAIDGALKEGNLVGEFRTEGFVSNWEAKKKGIKAEAGSAMAVTADKTDPITGEWDANFTVGPQKVSILLKLKRDGGTVTGTSESSVAGSGTLTDGSWSENKIAFTMPGPHGPVQVSGLLADGKLAGTFAMGQITGNWDATRK